MVYENQVAGAKTTEPDNEEIFRVFNNIGDGASAPDVIESALDEAVEFFPTPEEETKRKKKKPQQPVKKQAWTKEEEEEIRKLFRPFFESKERPKPNHCKKAQGKSKKSNGLIWKRKKDVLKKKVFRMIDKL